MKTLSKLKIAAVILILGFSVNLEAQVLIYIGQGTSANPNNEYPAPYGNWFQGAKQQFLIPASEILSSGGFPGMISSLAFNVAQAQGTPCKVLILKSGRRL